MKVIFKGEDNGTPKSVIACIDCGSLLEYTKEDLEIVFSEWTTDLGTDYDWRYVFYNFHCPVCGRAITAYTIKEYN